MQHHRRVTHLKESTSAQKREDSTLPLEVREIPMGLRRAGAWSWRIIIVVAALWLFAQALGVLATLVVSVLVAVLLASLLQPFVSMLTKHTFLPRSAAAAIALLGLIIVVSGMFVLAGRQLMDSWESIYNAAASGITKLWSDVSSYFKIDLSNLNQLQEQALNQIKSHATNIIDGASSFASVAGNIGTGILTALFTLFFLLAGGGGIWRWLLGWVPGHARLTTHEAFRRGWKALSAYTRTQVLVAAVDATGISLGMVGIDIVNGMLGNKATALTPFAVPIWLIVFLFSFIPLVGAIAAGVIVVLLVFVLQGWVAALVMLGIVVLVQQLESNVLQPILMGKAVELHPIVVFLGVTAGATVAGVPGALFAIPLLAFANAIYGYLDGRDPAPELGYDEKTAEYFVEREKERQKFFAQRRKQLAKYKDQ